MFRIKKIFENDLTAIIKIEGQIPDDELSSWSAEISALIKRSDRQLILDTCELTFISPRAAQVMIDELTGEVFLLNSPTFLRNLLHSAHRSAHVLD